MNFGEDTIQPRENLDCAFGKSQGVSSWRPCVQEDLASLVFELLIEAVLDGSFQN